MALRSRSRQDALLVGCFLLLLLLLGRVSPWQEDAEEEIVERCLLPSDEGLCKALFRRWYHDRNTKTCKIFSWGGCGGNDNNFKSKENCEKTCHVIKDNREICLQPPLKGPCRALHERWFYDRHTEYCNMFTYGGCEGNANNFLSEEDCEKTCWMNRNGPSFCYSPKDEGACSGSVTRFYYNGKMKTCEKFIYTGCGGNENNFARKKDCIKICKKGKKPKPRT